MFDSRRLIGDSKLGRWRRLRHELVLPEVGDGKSDSLIEGLGLHVRFIDGSVGVVNDTAQRATGIHGL